jgi:VanZ family protein
MVAAIRIAFWAAALFAFVMAVLPHPVELLEASDKVQHMVAFFTITALGCAAYRGLPRVKLMLAMVAFGGLIELVQMIPQLHRDSQWSDWLADILAVLLALAIAHLIEGRRAKRAE